MKNPIFFVLASILLLYQCKDKETPTPPGPEQEEQTVLNSRQISIAATTTASTTYDITHYRYSNNEPVIHSTNSSNHPVDITISDNDVLLFSAAGHTPVTIDFVSGSRWIEQLQLYMSNVQSSTTCNNSTGKTLSGTAKARIDESSFQPVRIDYHRNGRQIQFVSSNTANFGYTININDTSDNQCIKDLRFTTNSNRKARIFITSVSNDNIELDVFLDDSTSGIPGSATAPTDDSKKH